jgi:L-threonylcarbamoyladenylate synthase
VYRAAFAPVHCPSFYLPVATDLIEIDIDNPDPTVITRAVKEISRGGVIGVPTDALYVLVADPLNLQAVGRVFASKGRDNVRSLPMAISDVLMAEDLGRDLDSRFYILARHFWPGPLTMIVPASAKVPLKVTGNTGRLALRQSKSKTLNAMIDKIGHALIATSANLSGEPTICSGIELFAAMDGRIDLVLEGGLCAGPGSTTIDITEPYLRVIKEGGITEKEITERLQVR